MVATTMTDVKQKIETDAKGHLRPDLFVKLESQSSKYKKYSCGYDSALSSTSGRI